MQEIKTRIQTQEFREEAVPHPEEGILRTLAYFDLFDYPLTRKEIQQFMPDLPVQDDLSQSLDGLVCRQSIFLYDGFYLLRDDPALIARRLDGNERASGLLKKARRIGRFLYQFPFVRAVGISGSLSKNFADDKADIDFFIITRQNRLWVARTLLHLYKKITFLTGRQHYHCMNYFIDTDAFCLQEQNIFTAIEIKTLLPVSGEKVMRDFFAANNWADNWLPHCNFRLQAAADKRNSFVKRAFEWMLNGKTGKWLENTFYRVTARRWKKKETKGLKNKKGINMGLVTGIHYAKSDPGGFQQKVLLMYEERASMVLQKYREQSMTISSAK